MKILVTGGNGFIGREVCRRAAEAGHEVVSVARSGRPEVRAGWAERVAWVAADALEPAAWREHLAGCGAVVHCIGIVREQPARGVTFERINGESARVAAREAARQGAEAFVFLSASARPPFLREAYLSAKRGAEEEILRLPLRPVVLRPGLVYGTGRLPSLAAALGVGIGAMVPVLGRAARESRPLAVETVARAALRAATDPSIRGVQDVDAIERLGRG